MSVLMASATVYSEGQVHVRGVTPLTVAKGAESVLVLRGQGFDASCADTPAGTSAETSVTPEVRFKLGSKTAPGVVLGITCDVDVYQRVTVKVTLDELGQWSVQARNNPNEPWSTEFVTVGVL